MPQKAPGRCDREGLSLLELFDMFPDDETAERWWVAQRWPNGVACSECGSLNVQHRKTRKPQPYRCRDCRYDFSARTRSLMESSPLGFRKWVLAIYILTTNIKGTSSMKLHRDLRVTQKTAWFMAHRIRETWAENSGMPFTGVVEADETWLGGKQSNKPKRKRLGRQGAHTMIPVVGVKDRESGHVRARVIPRADDANLLPFVRETAPGALVCTDEKASYRKLPLHESVNHGIGQYVDGQAHTNGIESFWAMLKRGYHGTYHRMSPKHLQRYVAEFAGRNNDRPLDTLDQMRRIVRSMDRKRLTYRALIRPTGRQTMAE